MNETTQPATDPIIVMAEDSPTQAAGLKAVLAEKSSAIHWAKDGAEALAMVKALKPAIVISDIEMPVVTGYELSRIMKSATDLRHIPIILLTELASPAAITQAIDSNADCMMMKPCHEERLYDVIDRLIQQGQRANDPDCCEVVRQNNHWRSLLEFVLEELADQHRRLVAAEEELDVMKFSSAAET